MATFLRTLSYQYQWLYDTISRLASLTVGGETRFRHLALQDIPITRHSRILDLCCGAGQTTQYLVHYSDHVVGLDISPLALKRAKQNVPQAEYVEALAEDMPFEDNTFDLIHSSTALHEMTIEELTAIFKEVYRVLKPGGIFTFIDLHQPTNPLFTPSLYAFLWLFETETAWGMIKQNLGRQLQVLGFTIKRQALYAGGSLQVIQVMK